MIPREVRDLGCEEYPLEETSDQLEWLALATMFTVGYSRLLIGAIERGEASLGVDPSAWENALGAAECAMVEQLRGRIQGPTTITEKDIERLRRLRALGVAALSGGERSPELHPLALQCIEAFYGPDWKRYVPETDYAVREFLTAVRPDTRTTGACS